ncbi:MAG: acyltransferase [Muribaculaceae bacterium]|nr:acyltransferase [Muribaculaceae bacterium]
MTDNKTIISNAFRLLRLPLALMVVLIHSRPYYTGIDDSLLPAYNMQLRAVLNLLNVAVPVFFFMSGWLFFRGGARLELSAWVEKLKRRVPSLLVPYVIGNLIFVLLILVKKSPLFAENFPQYADFRFFSLDMLRGFIHTDGTPYPYVVPLWFLRNLMVAVLAVPVISLLLRLWTPAAPLLFAAMALIIPSDPLMLTTTLLWFSFGAAFSVTPSSHRLLTAHPLTMLAGALMLAGGIALSLTELPITLDKLCHLVYTAGGILLIVSLASLAARRGIKVAAWAAELSFFIYVVHGQYFTYLRKVVGTFLFPTTIPQMWLTHLADAAVIAGVTIVIYIFVRTLMPRYIWLLGARPAK